MCINMTPVGIIRVKACVRLPWRQETFVLFLDKFSPWHAILRDGGHVSRKSSTYRNLMKMLSAYLA